MGKKAKKQKIDGLSSENVKRIRAAIRKVWEWSTPRKLCLARSVGSDGFPRCEKCKKRVPKVYADHLTPVGDVDAGFIDRLFCPSKFLQALCKKCHSVKTAAERKARKEMVDLGF